MRNTSKHTDDVTTEGIVSELVSQWQGMSELVASVTNQRAFKALTEFLL